MNIKLGQDTVKYKGSKVKVAVVTVHGVQTIMGLSDTTRCAYGQDVCERTLKNLAKAAGADPDEVDEGNSMALQTHCRELLGLQAAKAA